MINFASLFMLIYVGTAIRTTRENEKILPGVSKPLQHSSKK